MLKMDQKKMEQFSTLIDLKNFNLRSVHLSNIQHSFPDPFLFILFGKSFQSNLDIKNE